MQAPTTFTVPFTFSQPSCLSPTVCSHLALQLIGKSNGFYYREPVRGFDFHRDLRIVFFALCGFPLLLLRAKAQFKIHGFALAIGLLLHS